MLTKTYRRENPCGRKILLLGTRIAETKVTRRALPFLLHDVLKERPELIPDVMPELWKDARAAPWQSQEGLRILEKEIRAAFARLMKQTTLYAKHCFCFFIDGLDEYQETAQTDLKEMANLLNGWTATAPQHVKLCVSSREYNVIMNAFSAEQRLRLHDLTWFDMEVYAHDKLGDISDQFAKQKLVTAILDKAQGIFLWVALVVKDMRNEMENGADSAATMELVRSLPEELDRLFEHILKSLNQSDRRKAYQTLAILSLAKKWRLSVSLFAYSFLDKYDADTTFAERDGFVQAANAGMTAEERIELGRKRVNGWCKGLVDPAIDQIDYPHRSIHDFLQNKTTKKEMKSYLAGFSAVDALCQLILAQFSLQSSETNHSVRASRLIGSLVGMRHAYGLDHAPFTFLCLLETPVSQHRWREFDPTSASTIIGIPVAYGPLDYWEIALSASRPGTASLFILASALYCCTYSFADHGYPAWKIANDPIATDSATKVALLTYTSFARQFENQGVGLPVLDALLDRGLLTSSTRTRLIPFPHEISTPMMMIGAAETADLHGIKLSVWQHYLISRWLFQHRSMSNPESLYRRLPDGFIATNLGAVAERFLRHGAESRFTASVSHPDLTTVHFAFGGDLASETSAASENPTERCSAVLRSPTGTKEELDLLRRRHHAPTRMPVTAWRPAYLEYKYTLRNWVEGLKDMPNKEEVLRLLDREEHARGNDLLSGVVEAKVSKLEALVYAVALTLGQHLIPSNFAMSVSNRDGRAADGSLYRSTNTRCFDICPLSRDGSEKRFPVQQRSRGVSSYLRKAPLSSANTGSEGSY